MTASIPIHPRASRSRRPDRHQEHRRDPHVHTLQTTTALTRDEFASLLDRERDTLRVIAAAEVGRSDAEDVVQEASLRALKKLGDFTPGTNFRAWMSAFVRMTASNHRRSDHRRRKRHLSLARRSSGARHDPPGATEGMDERLVEALEQLTSDQRICLLLKAVMSMPYEAIASTLGIPVTTARSHVFRARKRMLEIMPQEGHDER